MEDKIYNGISSTMPALTIPNMYQNNTYGRPYIDWGIDNQLPTYISDLYTVSPTHQAVLDSKRNALMGDIKILNGGDSIDLEDVDGYGNDIYSLLESTNGDVAVYETLYWEFVYNKQRTRIVNINHIPYTNVRVGKYGDNGRIESVFISNNWSRKYIKRNTPKEIATYDPNNVDTNSQIYISRVVRPGQPYYTVPSYMSAVQYILLEDDIAELQRNNIHNGFFPSILMNFFNGEPTEDEKSELEGYINNKFKGAAGSKIMMFFGNDPDKKVQLDTFEQPNYAEYIDSILPACMKKILTAHTASPLMVGVHTDGGLSNKAEELEANYQLYMKNSIVPLQKLILKALNAVYKFNGKNADIFFINEMVNVEDYSNGDASINVSRVTEEVKIVEPIKKEEDEKQD